MSLEEEQYNKDIDQVLGIVHKNYERRKLERQTDEMIALVNANYEHARARSIGKTAKRINEPKKYQPRSKSKPKNYLKNTIIVLVASATIVGVGRLGLNALNNTQAGIEFTNEISEHVRDNIVYLDHQLDENGRTMWYYDDVKKIAGETLNENKDVDIDTRIYGTYMGLQEYQKDAYMDEIMAELQKTVQANPLNYSEEEVRACNHATFADYLVSLNLDKKDYLNLMKDISAAYGKNDLDRVSELLVEFKGEDR